jgi:hypothetical protein
VNPAGLRIRSEVALLVFMGAGLGLGWALAAEVAWSLSLLDSLPLLPQALVGWPLYLAFWLGQYVLAPLGWLGAGAGVWFLVPGAMVGALAAGVGVTIAYWRER